MSDAPPPRSLIRKLLAGIAYLGFLGSVLAVSSAAGWANQTPMSKAIVSSLLRREPPAAVFGREITLLLLGCDVDLSTGGAKVLRSSARTDMMLVAKLDFVNNRITGVSIPRDTACRLPGYRRMKINAYHAVAKPEEAADLTKRAVEHILPGVQIDRVVTLNYDAFQRVVNQMGGIDVIVPFDMKYTDRAGGLFIDLKAGNRHLDGYKAMGFVRYRKGDRGYRSVTDFERQQNQKRLLIAFKDQALHQWKLLPQILQESKDVMGNSLTESELTSIAMFAKDLPDGSIQMGQIPVVEQKGSTILEVDEARLPTILDQFGLREHVEKTTL